MKRDDPDMAERVLDGELNPNAAARSKGWTKPRIADDLDIPYRRDMVRVDSDADADEIQRSLNADRRQLSEEQRRDVVATLRQDGHSHRAIGGALGIG